MTGAATVTVTETGMTGAAIVTVTEIGIVTVTDAAVPKFSEAV